MASRAEEDDPAEWHQQDVSDLARRVRQDTGEDDDEGEQPFWCRQHQQAEHRGDQPARLHHANPEHRHQHGAERRKAGEVGHHLHQDPVESGDRQQADRRDRLARPGMDCFQAGPDRHGGKQDDGPGQDRKERRRMRQGVSASLHRGEKDGCPVGQKPEPAARHGEILPRLRERPLTRHGGLNVRARADVHGGTEPPPGNRRTLGTRRADADR